MHAAAGGTPRDDARSAQAAERAHEGEAVGERVARFVRAVEELEHPLVAVLALDAGSPSAR